MRNHPLIYRDVPLSQQPIDECICLQIWNEGNAARVEAVLISQFKKVGLRRISHGVFVTYFPYIYEFSARNFILSWPEAKVTSDQIISFRQLLFWRNKRLILVVGHIA